MRLRVRLLDEALRRRHDLLLLLSLRDLRLHVRLRLLKRGQGRRLAAGEFEAWNDD